MTTPAELLNIGIQPGQNFFNIGIGRPDGHTDYNLADFDNDLDELADGMSSPEFVVNLAGDAVQFRVLVGAETTSEHTDHPRCELRELNPDGSLAKWDGRTNTHRLSGVSRGVHLPPKKPWTCIAQIHGKDDDLMRLQIEHGTLVCRNTPPGSDKETSKTVQASYQLGDPIVWDIVVVAGLGSLYIGGLLVQQFPAATKGLYFKAGDYLQTNLDKEKDKTEYGLVEILKGTLMCWHTGYPPASVPAPTPVGEPAPVPVPTTVPVPVRGPAPTVPVVMIIRHGEKPSDEDDHALSATGRLRAAALAELFTRPNLPVGLHTPDSLMVSKGHTASLRPLQTLTPLSQRLGLAIDSHFDAAHARECGKALKKLTHGVTLVCWAHEEIPDIVKAMGTVAPKPPKSWPDDRFDDVWVLTGDGSGGWVFSQVPELIMPGDKATVIK